MLSDVLAQKENLLQREIEEKTQQHRKWNANHIDLTREPLSPVNGRGPDTGFRPATAQYQYLMTPPSSVTSETFEQPSVAQENIEPAKFRYDSPEEDDNRSRPAYRRRIGRGGRLWIDRRGMSSSVKTLDDEIRADRYKFDEDDDDEQPVYEMDPYDTRALKFRATIPFPAHLAQNSRRVEPSRPTVQSPPNSRPPAAAAAASQPAVTAPTS
jgi:enhancer of polycomb-like protein